MSNRNFYFLILLLSIQISHAQFPEIKWEYEIGAPSFGSPAAADMDGDGFYEIVFTTYTNDGRAHCINAEDGSVNWIYDIGGCGDVAPIIHDMNMDGVLDVVVNGSCNPTIFCINGATGELIWSKPSGGGDSPPTVADIDNDGKPEVIFGNFNGQIISLNGEDGSADKTIQADPFAQALQTEPALVDIDNDGDLEIIAANYWNNDGLHVWAFDYETTNVIWTNTVEDPDAEFHAYHAGAVADLDGDGTLEYVIGSWNGDLRSINVEDGSDHWTIQIPESNFAAITVADIDEDGNLEVIMNNNDWITIDERLWIIAGEDGSVEWSYPIPFVSFRGFSVSDINGNGKLDLVSGHFMGRVLAIEPYTGLIWEANLLNNFSNADQLPWLDADGQPLIADFDQNGTLDVFICAGYGSYIPDSLNTGKAFMIEAGEGTCPEWLMFRHDVKRSGYISAMEIEEACNVTSTFDIVTENEISIYPNPSESVVFIEYVLNETSNVEVSIFDLLGREIQKTKKERQAMGTYKSEWEGISAGVYICEIRIAEQTHVERIVIVQ